MWGTGQAQAGRRQGLSTSHPPARFEFLPCTQEITRQKAIWTAGEAWRPLKSSGSSPEGTGITGTPLSLLEGEGGGNGACDRRVLLRQEWRHRPPEGLCRSRPSLTPQLGREEGQWPCRLGFKPGAARPRPAFQQLPAGEALLPAPGRPQMKHLSQHRGAHLTCHLCRLEPHTPQP